jgi:hypothetical protein
MSKSNHHPDSPQFTQNQNNQMSEDPGDGSRNSFKPGRDGEKTAAERPPEQDEQDQSAIETFAEEGAGVAAKE